MVEPWTKTTARAAVRVAIGERIVASLHARQPASMEKWTRRPVLASVQKAGPGQSVVSSGFQPNTPSDPRDVKQGYSKQTNMDVNNFGGTVLEYMLTSTGEGILDAENMNVHIR